MLNFVNEKVKLVYKINTRLAFQTSKTTIYNKQATNFRIKVHIQISIIVSLEELWKIYDLLYSILKQVKQNS